MSKIRIYELAKELGVENKVVLTVVSELGISGKSSHSSSLDSDEADSIRRAVIRRAIGSTPDSEVLTRRVDRTSGATGTFLEKRKGNVIRRRRQDETDEPTPEAVEEVSASEESPSEETQEDFGGNLAIRREPEQEVTAETQGESEPAIPEQTSASTDNIQVETVHARKAPTPVDDSEPAPIISSQPVRTERRTEVTPTPPVAVASAILKKSIGPKILGRIELAPAKKPIKLDPKKGMSGAAEGWSGKTVVDAEPDDEDTARAKLKEKRKGRKKEITSFDMLDYEGGRESRRGPRGARRKEDKQAQDTMPMKASKRVVEMTSDMVTVGELAQQLSVKSGQVIQKLIELGVMATINQAIDKDTAEIIADGFGFKVEMTSFDETTILENKIEEAPENLKPRSPVVTVMGHVDHGKTSLLDAIRKTSVAAGEAGGITQHIGAYQVKLEDGRAVTFLDTPGHAAFTAMRARGAQITDIVILVCAADEGPKPQTIEALNHAKAAGVTIVVALTKIDKGDLNIDRVKQQLAELGLQPEDWGGDVMFFGVSATKNIGIKELLEGVLLVAEVKELKANPDRKARGTIIETRQDRGRGMVATVLVQAGTLRIGDVFVCGTESGRVRSMQNDLGEKLETAGPSTPIEITGIDGAPAAGDDFFVVDSDAQAREVASDRKQKRLAKERSLASGPISLEEFSRRANNLASAELNVILKGDVHGSIEAVRESIEKMSTAKVKVRVLHNAVGAVNESDVALAQASNAIIVGFNVRAEPRASADAEVSGVQLRFYRIIYELLDDVRKAMTGLLEPIKREKALGRVEVRETFTVSKVGTIAGCYVADGIVKRSAKIRILRDSKVVHEGKMSSLKRFKDDAREVQSGYECGIGIESYNDVKAGDIFEIYEVEEFAPTLED